MRSFREFIQLLQKRRLALGFVLAVALVGFGFLMSFHSYTRSQEGTQRIAHSLQVINRLETILSLMKDVETASRGYLASDDPVFLEPYQAAYPQLPGQLADLRRLVSDNPAQRRAADTLARFVDAKLSISRKQIRAIDKSSQIVRREYLLIGKLRMDRLRSVADRMIATERIIEEQRTVAAKRSFQNTLAIIFALSMLTFIVLITLYRLLDGELRQRAENEAQLRAYEAELQAKISELEVSNQELERMAFVASHDMQEPLRKIRTFGDLLTERVGPSLETDGRMFLSKIITSADRMSLLIRDLLNFSRLSSRREPFEPTSLNQLIDQVIGDLELTIRDTNALVSRDDLPVIDAAPSQLAQLFANLVSNALKYVQPGVQPQVRIAAEPVSSGLYPGLIADQPYVRLTISDNGIGFDEKYLDRIFEIFQRLHTKAHYQGTGIGLAICKRVVTYHHGYITAQSQEGVGTTFIIVLPQKQVVGETTALPAAQTAARSGA